MKNKLKKFFAKKTNKRKTKAQSLVEFALTLPVLLMLLSGIMEFGFLLNYYLSLVDATREVARVYSNFDPIENADTFYDSAAEAVIYALQPHEGFPTDTSRKILIRSDSTHFDDIIVSAYSITGGSATVDATAVLLDAPGGGEYHWSNNQVSHFDVSEIESRLAAEAPSTGVLVVEVFYYYDQVLGLPWLSMMPNPFPVHAFTIMPLSSAEPTPTP